MKLLVVRHAIAESRPESARTGQHDDLRPITPEGRRRMRQVAGGLQQVVPGVGVVATSPLVRARQTAEILAQGYPGAEVAVIDSLSPDHELPAFLRWLREQPADASVAAVGHEPHLGHLVSWLLSGRFTSFVELKKGSACLLDFPDQPAAGEGDLLWLMQPAQLRRLRKRSR